VGGQIDFFFLSHAINIMADIRQLQTGVVTG